MFEQADGLDLDREFAVAEPERARAVPEGGAPPGALLDLEADATPAGRDEGEASDSRKSVCELTVDVNCGMMSAWHLDAFWGRADCCV